MCSPDPRFSAVLLWFTSLIWDLVEQTAGCNSSASSRCSGEFNFKCFRTTAFCNSNCESQRDTFQQTFRSNKQPSSWSRQQGSRQQKTRKTCRFPRAVYVRFAPDVSDMFSFVASQRVNTVRDGRADCLHPATASD